MLKTLTAIGIGAALAFAPLAALAQTDTTTAPAAAPAATDNMAPAKDSMKAKPKKAKHHHMAKRPRSQRKSPRQPRRPSQRPRAKPRADYRRTHGKMSRPISSGGAAFLFPSVAFVSP